MNRKRLLTEVTFDKIPFDKIHDFLTDDEKSVLIILNEMKEIVNEYRVQAVMYLLQKLFGIPISFKFYLGATPSSEELLYTLIRFKYDHFRLGRKLIKVAPVNSDPETGMVRDARYLVTNFGRKFVRYSYSKDQQFTNVRKILVSFRKKALENGYMENIHRYASWVFIKEDIARTKPKSMVQFYRVQHGYDKRRIAKFYRTMKGL